jgi:hypothetical protein
VGHDTGWGYSPNGGAGGKPYGSMTVGAVGGLCIYDYILGIKWKSDPDVLGGVNWIANHFTVTENADAGNKHHLYYLYGLERAGILFGTEFFGRKEWYPEGANTLLDAQGQDGSWAATPGGESATVNTCFAILFLRRATKPLQGVASVDRVAR